jgi:hypothetical protein
MDTLTQHCLVGGGALNTKSTLQKTQVPDLQSTFELRLLLHKLCTTHLPAILGCRDQIRLSQPKGGLETAIKIMIHTN